MARQQTEYKVTHTHGAVLAESDRGLTKGLWAAQPWNHCLETASDVPNIHIDYKTKLPLHKMYHLQQLPNWFLYWTDSTDSRTI